VTTLSPVKRPRAADASNSGPLVLGYHAVSDAWPSHLAVSEALLKTQLGYLKSAGYVGLTASQAEESRQNGSLPPRAVVVTFDDGYASTLRALPVLEEVGFPATVFVVTGFLEQSEPMYWSGIAQWHQQETLDELRSLTWADAELLAERGWEVGSHTVTHPLLTKADDGRLHTELSESRAAIAARLGACTSVAYPYGLADERVAEAAKLAGYDVGYMLTFTHIADEPFRRPRVGLGPRDHGVRLSLQVSEVALAARRSWLARVARKARFRRSWLPDE
jgi:peptidoglycan/xylan/chitin deacetylase (PgdA/CDA1 family)